MRIAIAIATTGRPQVVADCVSRLSRQTRAPDAIHVCGAADEDVASVRGLPGVSVHVAPKGLTKQRNRLIEMIGASADIALYLDDDFVMHDTYVERIEALFTAHPNLVVTTGVLVADGIKLPRGYTFAEADAMLASAVVPEMSDAHTRVSDAYGCNFAVRLSVVGAHGLRFDERLPLYGWQEDVDFTTQLSRFGEIWRAPALTGVHLGTKGGRVSGLRFGYSQVANPIYLARKGTMAWPNALQLMSRNVASNAVGAVGANRVVDRRGRLKGNLMALYDVVVRRKVLPERVLEL